jgi:Protein of unknown function (DUF4238)
MGHHYVPQKYLSYFANPAAPEMVWLYDKRGEAPRLAAIDKVAQSHEFYTVEQEEKLAAIVEGPANPVIEKLVNGLSLTYKERKQLSLYIAVMLRRVPYRRRRIYEAIVPPVFNEIFADVRDEITAACEAASVAPELVSARLERLGEAERNALSNPPAEIHEAVRQPWPTPKMVLAVFNMAWRVLEAKGEIMYMTSDNPAFYFESYGLGTENSELTFPLSTTQCLHGCWQGPKASLCFLEAKQTFVKEANRRVASTTERLAFYHQDVDWLQPFLKKESHYLSRIQW